MRKYKEKKIVVIKVSFFPTICRDAEIVDCGLHAIFHLAQIRLRRHEELLIAHRVSAIKVTPHVSVALDLF